jgi:carbon monoxide dehydrogenase subunit G
MAMWTAQRHVAGPPEEVLTLLTDPEAIAEWAPVSFEVVDLPGARLQAGDKVRVRGALGGASMEFTVEVAVAADGHLVLSATGPIRLDVEYRAVALSTGSEVRAKVVVSGRGLRGRILAQATDALLAAGALSGAVGRIARQFEPALAA